MPRFTPNINGNSRADIRQLIASAYARAGELDTALAHVWAEVCHERNYSDALDRRADRDEITRLRNEVQRVRDWMDDAASIIARS